MSFKILFKRMILICLIVAMFYLPILVFSSSEVADDELPEIESLNLFDETKLRSNQFTQMDDLRLVQNHLTIPPTFVLVAQSSQYRLYVELDNFAFRLEHIDSGYIRGSSLADKTTNVSFFNQTFRGYLNSAAIIEYYSYDSLNGLYLVKTESMFTSSLTTVDYELTNNGFIATIHYGESKISLTIQMYLDEENLHVLVDNDSIVEAGNGLLHRIRLYPYFGAVLADTIPGYMIVPDGPGALVRYRALNQVTDAYSFTYYGSDIGVFNPIANAPSLSLPIFGMVHGINQHAFLGIIVEGASTAVLVVNPSRQLMRYHHTGPEFVYRQLYNSPVSRASAQAGSGRQVVQLEKYSTNIHIQYKMIDGEQANYVGMARSFQEYAIEQGILLEQNTSRTAIQTMLELIGAERKEGFIFDELVPLTTFEQAKTLLSELEEVIGPMTIIYKGVFQGGYSGANHAGNRFASILGNRQELLDLIEQYSSNGNDLALYLDIIQKYASQRVSTYRDVSQKVNLQLQVSKAETMTRYYIQPIAAMNEFKRLETSFTRQEIFAMALGSIGTILYSDYKDGMLDRYEVEALYRSTLAESVLRMYYYRPNFYLWSSMAAYLSGPMSTKQYAIYTDTVPFLSIVLSGLMDQFAPYFNFSANKQETMLSMIDFNLYPSYILTHSSAYALQNTELRRIYSSSYSTWKDRIQDDYTQLNSILSQVIDQTVVSRTMLAFGVVKTTYSNQVHIYVNYTNDVFRDGDLSIPPRSALGVN